MARSRSFTAGTKMKVRRRRTSSFSQKDGGFSSTLISLWHAGSAWVRVPGRFQSSEFRTRVPAADRPPDCVRPEVADVAIEVQHVGLLVVNRIHYFPVARVVVPPRRRDQVAFFGLLGCQVARLKPVVPAVRQQNQAGRLLDISRRHHQPALGRRTHLGIHAVAESP